MSNAVTPYADPALLQAQSAARSVSDAASDLRKSVRDTGADKDKNMSRINEAAQDFEAMFLTEMLKPMFEGIEVDPVFGGGKGEEVFRGFMLQEYGKMVAASGGIGLAEHVKAEMIRLQEQAAMQTLDQKTEDQKN